MCPLKPNELELVQKFSEGKTIDDVASKLNRSKNTIMTTIIRMRVKTETSNMTSLVAKALREGWIK